MCRSIQNIQADLTHRTVQYYINGRMLKSALFLHGGHKFLRLELTADYLFEDQSAILLLIRTLLVSTKSST